MILLIKNNIPRSSHFLYQSEWEPGALSVEPRAGCRERGAGSRDPEPHGCAPVGEGSIGPGSRLLTAGSKLPDPSMQARVSRLECSH